VRVNFERGKHALEIHCSTQLEFFLSNVHCTLTLCHYSSFVLQFVSVTQLPIHVVLQIALYPENMPESKRGKYSYKTLLDKYETLKKLESAIGKKDVAPQNKVPPNTLSMWLKNKDKIMKAFKGGDSLSQQKQRAGNHDVVDKALYKWFTKVREEGLLISSGMLKEKISKYARELEIETFKASNGWFNKWKGRHGIVFKTVSGKAKSCTADMTASWEETTLPTILTNYQLHHIFNTELCQIIAAFEI